MIKLISTAFIKFMTTNFDGKKGIYYKRKNEYIANYTETFFDYKFDGK